MPENAKSLSNILAWLGLLIGLVLGGFLLGRQLLKAPEKAPQPQKLKAITFPHHDLLLEIFPDLYNYFSAQEKTDANRIIFLSPNHYEPDSLTIKQRQTDFQLASGEQLSVEKGVLANLAEKKVITKDDAIFENEHGVTLHLPFIVKNFKNAQLVPLLLSRNISRDKLNSLVAGLSGLFVQNDTIMIISTDFSHYLRQAEAEQKDQETLRIVQEQDAEAVLKLSDDYIDCPACMYVLFQLLDQQDMIQLETLFHANSSDYLPEENIGQTTSYFVFKWSK